MKKFTINNLTMPLCEFASKFNYFESIYKKYVNYRMSKYILKPTAENIKCFDSSDAVNNIKKDESFFKYKMERGECFLLKINNFTLFIKPQTHLYIGDIGYFEKQKTKELIRTMKKLSQILGCKKTILSLSKNHWLYNHLIVEIQSYDSLPIGCYLFDDEINPNNIQFTHADYDTF